MATTLFFGLVVTACGELESDTLLQSTKVSPVRATHCLKIETDSGFYADGELTLAVDSGDGMVEELSDYYKQGSTVINKCYQDLVAVEVSAGTNGWIGWILYSDNGGQSYSPMSCPTCSNGHSTAFIIVDGNTDASIIPNRIMCVDVLSKGPCRLETTTTTTTTAAYELMGSGVVKCGTGFGIATAAECSAAYNSIQLADGLTNTRGLQQGPWNGVPYACSVQYDNSQFDQAPHWNKNAHTDNSRVTTGEFRMICKTTTTTTTAAPTTMTAFECCRREAAKLQLKFSDQQRSNGAPAGCVRYRDGRVIYVHKCSNHANCGTTKCNGCTVLQPSCTMTAFVQGWRIWASTSTSDWAWDVKRVKFIADGAELQVGPCTVVESAHVDVDGYGPENAFSDGPIWGGRKMGDEFFLGLECTAPPLVQVKLHQGCGHAVTGVGTAVKIQKKVDGNWIDAGVSDNTACDREVTIFPTPTTRTTTWPLLLR